MPSTHLTAWALLGVPLSVFDDAGPVAQQLVPLPVVPTLQAVMPGGVAPEAPHKLALATLDLHTTQRRRVMSVCNGGQPGTVLCSE